MPANKRIAAILYADFGRDARADDQDVLRQAGEFARVLGAAGYSTPEVRLALDLGGAAARLREEAPHFVVNLVETVAGSDSLQYLGPALLDHLGLPYTGCKAEAVFLCANKVLAKRMLRSGAIGTPPWIPLLAARSGESPSDPPWIVKPVAEHASRGIEEDSVVKDPAVLRERASAPDAGRYYVEGFVEGREFNVSLLGGPRGVEVLPPAEIDFRGFAAGKPRIVGYRAKWDERSFEYRHTPRRFDFDRRDRGLLDELAVIARRSWDLLGLSGYARVDFRIDRAGRPWVLEVNTNPCLSPDAGFAAAAARGGLSLDDVILRIIENVREK